MTRRRPPDPLPRLYRWRTNILQAPLFFLYTAICGSLSLFVSLFEKGGRLQHRLAQIWARGCIKISGSHLVVRGTENLRKYPVAVYAANHTSYMDTPVIFSTLPFQFRILAKKELWTMPFIGWHLNRSGQIPVDSVSSNSTVSSLGAAVRALRAGMPLFVFPEGARTPDGTTQPFLAGAAFLAIRAQVPLVPIALSGVYDLLPMHTRHFYPGEITLTVGEPISTEGMTLRQVEALNIRLRETIEQMRAQSKPGAIPAAEMSS
ncbi:lysophospholipid acyltransferase family protein [Telmatobacter sp. DSM 110680]|uniref:Lysophospholipid acyltransferase family protein n=1 Tax=Telmatobacter sp. DSM 110680 TaxID=3036704 RepID=A0AAU7DMS1_9BACT